jgi:hypothetical protein
MKNLTHHKRNSMSKPILTLIRDSKSLKMTTGLLALSFLFTMVAPSNSMALTGGPSQPEVNSFTPIGTSDMVDLFTGDLNYNIPLMDVGGYPLNISYSGGVTMDQEASWVGLGWNINPGVINRSMRSLPDDFKGDIVQKDFNMKPQTTVGLRGSGTAKTEIFGKKLELGISYGLGVSYNNYQGFGYSQSIGADMQLFQESASDMTSSLGFSISRDNTGLSISPSLNFSKTIKKAEGPDRKLSSGLGVTFNSREGLSNWSVDFADGEYKRGTDTRTNGAKGSSSLSFVNNTYVPQLDMPRVNASLSLAFDPGFNFFGLFTAPVTISGYTSTQRLLRKHEGVPAFGYMHSEYGGKLDRAMLDFNREKDASFTHNTPNLPLTNFTHDIFSIAGQGIGGTFRPFRSDMGHVFDPLTTNISVGASASFEAGGGQLGELGTTLTGTVVHSHTGKWLTDNAAAHLLRFKAISEVSPSNVDYEPYYLKQIGELTVESDEERFAQAGAFDPVQVPVVAGPGFQTEALGKYESQYNTQTYDPNTDTYNAGGLPVAGNITHDTREDRDRRNQSISTLDKTEARIAGLDRYISPEAKEHHIAEVNVLRNDGARYVYGIAAYNTIKEEISFNASGRSSDCTTGLVSYIDQDITVENDNGRDNYFNKITMPAYAHSYLLTAVLSHDYEDNDDTRGPSAGDYGSYTKFNYGSNNPNYNPSNPGEEDRYLPSIAGYDWRVPYQDHKANYSEGLKTDLKDQRGSIIHGKKDLWYINSIETKTHIAIFYLSEREDAHESGGVNGGLGARAMQKLDKIELYAKPDYQEGQTNPNYTAIPIKTVHFDYSYELCKNLPNNPNSPINGGSDYENSGKLTLIGVHFTYLNSNKGRLSDYEFNYADQNHDGTADINPDYHLKGYNIWGGYKPSTATSCNALDPILPNPEFAFVEQDKTVQDLYAMAWCLSSIELPSGGKLKMQYEADTYSLVQDKKAMEMLKIVGCGNGPDALLADLEDGELSELYHVGQADGDANTYLYFKLDEPASSHQEVRDRYLRELETEGSQIYFRFLADLTNSGDYDYVEGWASIHDADRGGVVDDGSGAPYDYGYIQVNPVPLGDDGGSATTNNHPVSKATWHYSRLHNPKLVYPVGSINLNAGPLAQLQQIASSNIVTQIINIFRGPNAELKDQKFATNFVPNKSWVRLFTPDDNKLGGGCRVSQISLEDNWEFMSDDQNTLDVGAQYGQRYIYESDMKSYGVATYEPVGTKENPFVQPAGFSEERFLAPDDQHYMEKPFGESFFPSPSVGYRQVEVVDLNNDFVTRHGTGKTIHSFYTAYDYPTRVDQTDLTPIVKKTSLAGQLLSLSVRDFMTVSQGYVIETNDMHGKSKSVRTYAEGQTDYISGIDYLYGTSFTSQAQDANAAPGDIFEGVEVTQGSMDNRVAVINTDGTVEQKMVGVNFDIVNDFRESETVGVTAGVEPNLNIFLIGLILGFTPSVWPTFAYQKTRFRSATTTKVIHRYGVLREVVVHDKGSSASTENLAWDAETGEVLLTKTSNQFGDPLYNFNYPAHWTYDRMGQAYKNISQVVATNVSATGKITEIGSYLGSLVPGDEVIYTSTIESGRAWVIEEEATGDLYLIAKDGQPKTIDELSVTLKVTRSGRRNQQAMAAGSVTSIYNPIDHNDDGVFNPLDFNHIVTADNSGILQAQAVEYSEDWRTLSGIPRICTINQPQANLLLNGLNTLASSSSLVTTGTAILVPNLVENGDFERTIVIGAENVCDGTVYDFCYPFTGTQPTCTSTTQPVTVTPGFSLNNLAFNSDYWYSWKVNHKCYRNLRISDDPYDNNMAWSRTDDHTFGDGTGHMLVIDGDPHIPNSNSNKVWYQNQTNLSPNTEYEFAFYVQTTDDHNGVAMPEIDLGTINSNGVFISILAANGQAYLDGVLQSVSCFPIEEEEVWHTVRGIFSTGPNQTEATIAIVSKQDEHFGNDYMIDDISLREVCGNGTELSGWWSSTVGNGGCTLSGTYGEIDGSSCTPCDISLTVQDCPAQFDFETISTFNSIEEYSEGVGNEFLINATTILGQNIVLIATTSCTSPVICVDPTCEIVAGNIVNPYVQALRGHYNAVRTHFYLTDREQAYDYTASSNFSDPVNTRTEGAFTQFDPFWSLGQNNTFVATPANWQSTVELTNVHPFTSAVETQDLLGRYAAELLGFYNTLPVATSTNARYTQLAYDGFEDYDFYPKICELRHFAFEDFEDNITELAAHTGKRSIRIDKLSAISNSRTLIDHVLLDGPDDAPYTLKEDDCLGTFGPETFHPEARRYVLNFWRKLNNPANADLLDFPDITAKVSAGGNIIPLVNEKISNVIEGWQQVEYQFYLPSGSSGEIQLLFNNNSNKEIAFVDDIRIHPFNSTMKTYAYDPHTLWLRAELDERNFATIYEYDEEGKLIRVKRETERGIVTVQESRSNVFKQDN